MPDRGRAGIPLLSVTNRALPVKKNIARLYTHPPNLSIDGESDFGKNFFRGAGRVGNNRLPHPEPGLAI